ncbi:MAG: hypothetical protein M3Q58_14525 [Bacteroidota bacterium]|nr:hypothetical protein [Bacteroidota bacterium]
MRKHFTIEKITISAFVFSLLLLMLAAYIFYRNALHLQKIQQKESEWKTTNPNITDKTINSIFSKAVFPDSREIFRPEVLKTNPVTGLQLSVAEYIVAIYIINNNQEGIENTTAPKKKVHYHITESENYSLARTNYINLMIALAFSGIVFVCLIFYSRLYKKHKLILNQTTQEKDKIKINNVLINFSKFYYTKRIKSSFTYSYSAFNYQSLLIFKNKTQNHKIFKKKGIEININPCGISLKNHLKEPNV